MDVFEPYKQELEELAQINAMMAEWLEATENDADSFLADLRPAFEPLDDGTLDPGDLETISDAMWEKFKSGHIADLKQSVRLHRKLMPLYEHMESASEEEWEALAKFMHDAALEGSASLFQWLAADRQSYLNELDGLE